MFWFFRVTYHNCILLAVLLFSLAPVYVHAMEDRLKRFTLANGLQVLIQEDHARKVAAIQFWVKVGSADETDSERGISHLIEHMAFKGTELRGVGKIASEVEALGGDINAYTSWDETVFHVTVPSNASSQGLDILTDAVLRPVINAEELEKEKQVVLEEILEGQERPERKSSHLLFKTAYVRSPYQYPIIGFKETVEKITREDILSFRKKWYVPDNMFLLVVGDVDATKLIGEIERLTADLKPCGFFRPPRAVEPVQGVIRSSILRDKNSRETRLHIAFHIPSIEGNDVNALDLAADILGARESSRLVKILKKEKGLVNSISAYALTPKNPGLMVISATLDSRNVEATTRAVVEQLDLLSKQPPKEDELERAKTYIESQHIYARETVQGTARSLGNYEADLGDAGYEEKYLTLNQAVQPHQISSVVRKYLFAPNVTIIALLPEGASEELPIDRLEAALKGFGTISQAPSADIKSGAKVTTASFPNGIKVVLAPDDSNPVVSFRIVHLGGKRFETRETEGIMNFMAQMINKGAGQLTEVEISRRVEDMGGRLSGFSGYDSFGISASFFSRYADAGLQLLALLHSSPSFPKDEFERERILILNRIKTEPDRPVAFAINQLGKNLFKDNPYGFNREGTVLTVSAFTPEDLKAMYSRFVVPSNTVISAVGDFDATKMMQRMEELFGSIPAKKYNKPEVITEKPLDKITEEIIKIPRAKAHIALGFAGTTFSDPDRYPLEVLNNILSGQGGRLFLELRDKESLAYTVASFVRPGLDPGMFAFYMACDVPKIDRAVKGLFREIERMRTGTVQSEELSHALTNLIGNHLIGLQSSWSRAENTALNTVYGLGYNYDEEYIKKISLVKPEDVLRVARKYLDPDRCALVKILPEQE